MIKISHKVNLDPLVRYQKDLNSRLSGVVRRTTFKVERSAKRNAPVDTGALRASIYSVVGGFSGFAASADMAAQKAAFGGMQNLSITKMADSTDPMTGYVVAGVHYAIYVEFGSFHARNTTRMSTRKSGATAQRIGTRQFGTFVQGRFFMTNALREHQAAFRTDIAAAIRGARA